MLENRKNLKFFKFCGKKGDLRTQNENTNVEAKPFLLPRKMYVCFEEFLMAKDEAISME